MIITLCGSTKFKPRFVEVKKELESYGIIVEMPPVFSKSEGTRLDGKEVSKLECLHFEKISYSDYICHKLWRIHRKTHAQRNRVR